MQGSIFYLRNQGYFYTVSIQRLTIKEFLHRSRNSVLLDVRSPGEYYHAHIPWATSFPLFTDEERKTVGTTYKQKSREDAIKAGLDFFGPKMRTMVEQAEDICGKKPSTARAHPDSHSIFIHCWRGGMRSAGVAWLLDLYGFKVFTLSGGYKAFRNYILDIFRSPFQIKLIGGYTGSGKTEVLHQLEKNGAPVIDLEKLASHKGSAFGNLEMPTQPTQEMFENQLGLGLLDILERQKGQVENDASLSPDSASFVSASTEIWMEDESQRIGNLNIPMDLWKAMRCAPIVFLEVPFEERLDHIVQEYGKLNKTGLIEAVQRISKRLGGLNTKSTVEFLETGNIKEGFRILLQYYDKHYLKGLHNRERLSALLTTVQCQTVSPENAEILTKHQPV